MYTSKSDPTITQLVKWQDQANEMLKSNQHEQTVYLDRSNDLTVHTGSSVGAFGKMLRKVQVAIGKPRIIETLEQAHVSISGYQDKLVDLRPLSANNARQAIQTLDPSNITVKSLHDTCCTILDSDAGMIAAAHARFAIFASQHTGHELKETMQYRTRRLTEALCSTIDRLTSGDDRTQIPDRAAIFEREVLALMRTTKGMPDASVQKVESHMESRKRVLRATFYPRTPAPDATEPVSLMKWLEEEVRKIETNDEITYPDGPEISKQAGKLREHLKKDGIVESLEREDLQQILILKKQIAWNIKNNHLYRDFRLSFTALFNELDAVEQQRVQKPAAGQPPSSDDSLSESTELTSSTSDMCRMTPYSAPPILCKPLQEQGAVGGVLATHPIHSSPKEALTLSNCHMSILALIQKTRDTYFDEMKPDIQEDIKKINREIEAAANFVKMNQKKIAIETLQILCEESSKPPKINREITPSLFPLVDELNDALITHFAEIW